MKSSYPCKRRRYWKPTYNGLEGSDRGELFIESENETLPSMHLLDQIIKRNMSPMKTRPRECARGWGDWRVSGWGGWRAVDRDQRGRGWGQEGVLRGQDGRGRRDVYILSTDGG